MFSQSKPATLEKLKEELVRLNCSFSEYTKKPKKTSHNVEHIFYVTGEIADYFIKNYFDRQLTWDILSWDYESRKLLFTGLMDGDGSINRKGKVFPNWCNVFWSKNKERLEIVSTLALSLGMRNYINYAKGCIYMNYTKNTTQLQMKHKKENILYSGKVWCLKVPKGAFVVMRNGRPFISGNSGFPKSTDISKNIDANIFFGKSNSRKIREIISERPGERILMKEIPKNSSMFQGMMANSVDRKESFTNSNPITPEAKLWHGYGTALKPAYEPLILAQKPYEETYANNCKKYGCGGLNIDGTRIICKGQKNASNGKFFGGTGQSLPSTETPNGRFPSNFCMDCSCEDEENHKEDCPVGMMNRDYGIKKSGKISEHHKRNVDGGYHGGFELGKSIGEYYSDESYVSRFFYTSKSSTKERNAGLSENENNHPTLKNINANIYFSKLIRPPVDLKPKLLVPFSGVGSEVIGSIFAGWDEIVSIEKEEEYLAIQKKRVDWWSKFRSYEKAMGLGKKEKSPIKSEKKEEKTKFSFGFKE
jgi:site-specific DNA-methyltransferase (adenine-specific)